MTRVGLTGGIGAGKSTAAGILAELGAVIIDADQLARDAVAPGSAGLAAVIAEFGPDVVTQDGQLDRHGMASRVFSDEVQLARLNAIVHPIVGARSAELLSAAPSGAIVVYDVALLVENGLQDGFDEIVVVDAPDDVRIERLTERGMDAADAARRIASQATREQRLAVADYVIDNAGDFAALASQTEAVWQALVSGE
jgi:dephospho-CoA kinase